MIELIGSALIICGAIIVAIALLHGDEPSPIEQPWSPPEPTIGTILSRINEEETADNRALTLHESPVV